ncbi:23S rRNA (adenine(1618)-N(6))-methyltransferase RlmF [Gilvimarinus polysaccharolyticus]|uniref:23S rRNA (adenine(1618)-N(6))-methyltransferase RlmF n=1 Tax=Gilvimarinus polysaccharolyticus TaxID=863921 RepID=UPI000673B694|nr:23S rRNA (adenine(1618)-N(6))-methyltransferase RlmF [Gilvimarinus polysaccharolyticus]
MSTPRPPTHANRQHAKSLHRRNLHNQPYDFAALINSHPALAPYVAANQHGNPAINFADAAAVKALNAALLKHHYHIQDWDIPAAALCPPIPGRADYLHYLAELLNVAPPTSVPATESSDITLLDIGTGASGIYPLLASQLYGWTCVATDINTQSLDNVAAILEHNPTLKRRIALRPQSDKNCIFANIILAGEFYDLSVCNPPFHASAEEALKSSLRKQENLARNRGEQTSNPSGLNFGGQAAELWCKGGERLFLKKMAKESQTFAHQCRWFSSLVSKSDNIKPLIKLLRKLGALEIKEIPMTQGNKITRVLAWRFIEY